MKLEPRSDGTLVVSERMSLLRWSALIAGVLLSVLLVAGQLQPGGIAERTFLAAGLAALLALAAAGFIPDREFEFESSAAQLRWSVWRLAYARGGSIPFHEITSVLVQTDVDAESRQRRESYRLVLVTPHGHLPLTSVREFDRVACERLAADVRERIGLTTRSGDARETIADLARNGSVADAVAMASRELGLGLADARHYVETLRGSKAA